MCRLIILMALFVNILVGCGPDPEPAPSPSQTTNSIPAKKILSVPFIPQFTQVWCWAAAEQMVLSYNGTQVPQDYIVTVTFGAPVLTAGYITQIQQGLYYIGGVSSYLYQAPLTINEIKDQISKDCPIIIHYGNSFSGHFVVLYGYDENNKVYINDPYFGQFTVPVGVSYSYNPTGQPLVWDSSLINIHR